MAASGSLETDEMVKIAIFLHTIGKEALEKYHTLAITPARDALTMEDLVTTVAHKKTFLRPIMTEISVDRHVTELCQRSKNFDFGSDEEGMVRDKLMFSINDKTEKETPSERPHSVKTCCPQHSNGYIEQSTRTQ